MIELAFLTRFLHLLNLATRAAHLIRAVPGLAAAQVILAGGVLGDHLASRHPRSP